MWWYLITVHDVTRDHHYWQGITEFELSRVGDQIVEYVGAQLRFIQKAMEYEGCETKNLRWFCTEPVWLDNRD